MITDRDARIICNSVTAAYDWRRGPTHLGSSQDVVPHRRPSEVDVEVGVAALHTHQAVPAERAGDGRGVHSIKKRVFDFLSVGLFGIFLLKLLI